MRNTNLLALAAALILACVWGWASSTGTKAAVDPFQAIVSPVRTTGTNPTIIDVSRYGANLDRERLPRGPCSPKKYLRQIRWRMGQDRPNFS